MEYRVDVSIWLKKGLVDREGEAIQKGLKEQGYDKVESFRMGKLVGFRIGGLDRSSVEKEVVLICESFLINPVLETYHYELVELN